MTVYVISWSCKKQNINVNTVKSVFGDKKLTEGGGMLGAESQKSKLNKTIV